LFLDYYATGKLRIAQAKAILTGIVAGCRDAGCPLVGGETAEMPGMYQGEDLDLAGFAVGILDRAKVVDGSKIKAGHQIIGLPSSGLHSNGYSLARRVLGEEPARLRRKPPILDGRTVGEALLEPTRIYVRQVTALLDAGVAVHGMAHITGGGLPGNLNRILPQNLDAHVVDGSWPVLPIFDLIAREGPVERQEMFRTFNMGIGYTIVVPAREVDGAMDVLKKLGENPMRIGEIRANGSGQVVIEPTGD
jgi:phosphoribosylformylglycinamidine cyclo-ligase